MKAFNSAMKAMATFLKIPNKDLDEIFGLLEQPEYFTKSRIKAWCVAKHDRKYRAMEEADFSAFCTGLYWYLNETPPAVELHPDDDPWTVLLNTMFGPTLPTSILNAVGELIEVGTDEPNDKLFFYSRLLHQFCLSYDKAMNLTGGFSTDRSKANDRLLGVLWLVCDTGERTPGATFRAETFEQWSAQVTKELNRDGLQVPESDTEHSTQDPASRSMH